MFVILVARLVTPPPPLLLPPPPPTGPGWEDVVRRWLPESPICSEVDTTERGGVQPELSRGFLLPPPPPLDHVRSKVSS